jgi:hypothetical protein
VKKGREKNYEEAARAIELKSMGEEAIENGITSAVCNESYEGHPCE